MAWGQSPVVWPNPHDLEGRARFVLDDPSEAYLWRGLEECGRASVEALNWASKLVSRDMFKFAQVKSLSPFSKVFCIFGLVPCIMFEFAGAPSRFLGEVDLPPWGTGRLGGL